MQIRGFLAYLDTFGYSPATTARKIATHEYCTHLFLACWADGETLVNLLDDRPVYLELGCL